MGAIPSNMMRTLMRPPTLTLPVMLLLAACETIPPEQVPESAATLLPPSEQARIDALRRAQESMQNDGALGFGGLRTVPGVVRNDEAFRNRPTTLLRALAEDPSLLGDPERLNALAGRDGFEAEMRITEWDPRKLRLPGDVESREMNELLKQGWSIQRIGWDPETQNLVLYWMRLRPVRILPAALQDRE